MGRVTDTISGSLATFRTPYKQDIRSLKAYFTPKQEGSGTPSPDNVRPITGWTGVEVGIPSTYQQVEYLESSGTQYIGLGLALNIANYCFYFRLMPLSLGGTSSSNNYAGIMGANAAPQVGWYQGGWTVGNAGSATPYLPAMGQIYEIEYSKDFNGTYYVDGQSTGIRRSGTMTCKLFWVEHKTTNAIARVYKAYAVDKDGAYAYNLIPCVRKSDSKPGMYDIISKTFFTNAGNGEFTYGEAVNEYNLTADWSSAGTVYGGYVDLVTGEVWADTAMVDMGDLKWTYVASDTVFYAVLSNKVNGAAKIKCSCYASGGNTGYSTPGYTVGYSTSASVVKRIFVGDPRYTTAASFKEAVAGQQLTYKLVEPQLVTTLTPTALRTLIGTNNIWCNSGDVEVKYDFAESWEISIIRKMVLIEMSRNSALINTLKKMNVVAGLTWEKGYINASGNINGAGSATKEVVSTLTSNPFEVGEEYIVLQRVNGAKSSDAYGWFAIGHYAADGTFRVREVPTVNGYVELSDCWFISYVPHTPAYTDGNVRFSFRTYGNCETYVISVSKLMQLFVTNGISDKIVFDDIET